MRLFRPYLSPRVCEMDKKIICFGVCDPEKRIFLELEAKYGYEFFLKNQGLSDCNYEEALGHGIVMLCGNCYVTRPFLKKLYEGGLKYCLICGSNYGQKDIMAFKQLGIKTVFVPECSSFAISELAVTLALALLRNVAYALNNTSKGDFRVTEAMFSKEIRECVVGIIGCGSMGYSTARLFKSLGANILAYDLNPNLKYQDTVTYADLNVLLSESDVISLHMDYIPGKNDKFIDEKKLALAKNGAILINTAQGELLDSDAAVKAITEGRLGGLGLDSLPNEQSVFNHVFSSINDIPDPLVRRMLELYPKVLITPHVASATDEAQKDRVEKSLRVLEEYLVAGSCKNGLVP